MEKLMEPRIATAMRRRIETPPRAVEEVSMEKKPPVVRRGMKMRQELEAGPVRQVLREEKTQTEQDHRLAEGSHRLAGESQRLMLGIELPLAGFG